MNSKLKTRFGMSLAYMGGCPIFLLISGYLTYFYTNVVGLSAGIIGTILFVSKILNGVSDTIFGNMIDKTRTKMGVCRPWVFRMSIFGLIGILACSWSRRWATQPKMFMCSSPVRGKLMQTHDHPRMNPKSSLGSISLGSNPQTIVRTGRKRALLPSERKKRSYAVGWSIFCRPKESLSCSKICKRYLIKTTVSASGLHTGDFKSIFMAGRTQFLTPGKAPRKLMLPSIRTPAAPKL